MQALTAFLCKIILIAVEDAIEENIR